MKWLKYGCFGCLGALLLLVLVVASLAGVAYLRARTQGVEQRTLTPDLPSPSPAAPSTDAVSPGRVVLDLKHSGFLVEAGAPGERLHVEASYNASAYELEERYEPDSGQGWVYSVAFRRTAPWLLTSLQEVFGAAPQVRIVLPPDLLMDLELSVEQGGCELQLGGLWLRNVDLSYAMAGLEPIFDRPLREPLERLSIHGSMGGLNAVSVGNASPRSLSADISMGGISLDLEGQWLQDSDISISTSMGGGEVDLPDSVAVEGLETARLGLEAKSEVPRPTLRFKVSTQRGDLKIR